MPTVPESDAFFPIFDFADPGAVLAWAPIDDRVMGGVSRSGLRHDAAGFAVFEGEVSLERNGGFASVRSRPGARGQPGATACVIEARGGGGKRFKLILVTDDGFDSVSYQSSFTPSAEDWRPLRLPISGFRATFRGRVMAGAAALDPSAIRQVGIMISDRQAGPFELCVRRIGLA
jgi:hypothetical protein